MAVMETETGEDRVTARQTELLLQRVLQTELPERIVLPIILLYPTVSQTEADFQIMLRPTDNQRVADVRGMPEAVASAAVAEAGEAVDLVAEAEVVAEEEDANLFIRHIGGTHVSHAYVFAISLLKETHIISRIDGCIRGVYNSIMSKLHNLISII